MASEDISTSPVIIRKRTASRKPRILGQSIDDTAIDNLRSNRALTAKHRSFSRSSKRLPNSEPLPFKRCQSQQKDLTPSSPAKLQRQSTAISYQIRLPTVPSLSSDDDQKRTADYRRRQIYALNHLMRNLEQEQFRQFCKLHNIGGNEHASKESST